jgi:hypothetical protein
MKWMTSPEKTECTQNKEEHQQKLEELQHQGIARKRRILHQEKGEIKESGKQAAQMSKQL